MRRFTVEDSSADLSQPTPTSSGRYWYNLHVVLVVHERHRIVDEPQLATICDWCSAIGRKRGVGYSSYGA